MTTLFFNDLLHVILSIGIGMATYQLIFYILKRIARQKKYFIPSLFSQYIYYPGLFLIITISLWVALLLTEKHMYAPSFIALQHALKLVGIGTSAFLLVRIITVLREIGLHHYQQEDAKNYSLRKAKTKFSLIQKVVNFLIIFATIAVMLMTFSAVRSVGSTLLASAGVVGLIIGFAAQKSLGTLFAGIQIAMSQPIRIDDIVVVEEQFGIIAEITLTYVVVNTWDGRRLIVPISYFLEKPFENWTRTSPEVVGKVKVYADYSLPVKELRAEFLKWLQNSPLWDQRKAGLLVTAATENTIEVRTTMSAQNSDDAFDLECNTREWIISFIRDNYPYALPKSRVDVGPDFKKD